MMELILFKVSKFPLTVISEPDKDAELPSSATPIIDISVPLTITADSSDQSLWRMRLALEISIANEKGGDVLSIVST